MDVVGALALLMVFGSPAYIVAKIQEHRTKRAKIDADARALAAGAAGDPKELEALRKERKLLVERIENLETIVCSVDHDLNQKLVKLIDEGRMLTSGAGVPPSPGPGPTPPGPAGTGLDKTMTQAVPRPRGPNELLPGDTLAGRYKIERLLGRGGMGAVYLAHDEVLGELVALKLISAAWASDEKALVDRFKREAAAARKVSSP